MLLEHYYTNDEYWDAVEEHSNSGMQKFVIWR